MCLRTRTSSSATRRPKKARRPPSKTPKNTPPMASCCRRPNAPSKKPLKQRFFRPIFPPISEKSIPPMLTPPKTRKMTPLHTLPTDLGCRKSVFSGMPHRAMPSHGIGDRGKISFQPPLAVKIEISSRCFSRKTHGSRNLRSSAVSSKRAAWLVCIFTDRGYSASGDCNWWTKTDSEQYP